jgi:hypothetical protein
MSRPMLRPAPVTIATLRTDIDDISLCGSAIALIPCL